MRYPPRLLPERHRADVQLLDLVDGACMSRSACVNRAHEISVSPRRTPSHVSGVCCDVLQAAGLCCAQG